MATTFSQAQAELLNSGELDTLGSDRYQYQEIRLNHLASALLKVATIFQKDAVKNLQKADRISTGNLQDSIHFENVKIAGSILSIDISVADYYKFVDKGVTGWQGTNGDSTYRFKKYTGKAGTNKSAMVDAIKKWLIREGLKQRNNKYSAISKRERKRKKITDTSTSTAIAISKSIRKKGLKKTNFWTDAVNKIDTSNIAEGLKLDIIETINGNNP